MKALTVRPPWAHAIIHLGKDVENRSWPTSYRGPLAIHSGSRWDPIGARIIAERTGKVCLPGDSGAAILGLVDLVDCRWWEAESGWESPWSGRGQWHWILQNPRAIEPVAMPGRLGLWTVELEVRQ